MQAPQEEAGSPQAHFALGQPRAFGGRVASPEDGRAGLASMLDGGSAETSGEALVAPRDGTRREQPLQSQMESPSGSDSSIDSFRGQPRTAACQRPRVIPHPQPQHYNHEFDDDGALAPIVAVPPGCLDGGGGRIEHGLADAHTQGRALDEIQVTLQRGNVGMPLGMSFDASDGRLLHLSSVISGATAAGVHNNTASEEQCLRDGDYIVNVNGVTGNARAMLREIQLNQNLSLTVRRAIQFSAMLDKKGRPLGLSFVHAGPTASLIVETVADGPVAEWNQAHPREELRPGDRIVAVNGMRGGASELLQKLAETRQTSAPVVLCASRPAGLDALRLGEKAAPGPGAGSSNASTSSGSARSSTRSGSTWSGSGSAAGSRAKPSFSLRMPSSGAKRGQSRSPFSGL